MGNSFIKARPEENSTEAGSSNHLRVCLAGRVSHDATVCPINAKELIYHLKVTIGNIIPYAEQHCYLFNPSLEYTPHCSLLCWWRLACTFFKVRNCWMDQKNLLDSFLMTPSSSSCAPGWGKKDLPVNRKPSHPFFIVSQ